MVYETENKPKSTLPSWQECALRYENTEYLRQQGATDTEGSLVSDPLTEFIYEYDCSDDYKSAWWRHRLERMIKHQQAKAVRDALSYAYKMHDKGETMGKSLDDFANKLEDK
jgi:hypothetical protein